MKIKKLSKLLLLTAISVLGILLGSKTAFAYVGPGAGFALIGSGFALLSGIFAFVFAFLFWPIRILWKTLTGKKTRNAKSRRIIIIGLDGLDPKLTNIYMSRGRLPNLAKLAKDGTYTILQTTNPPISPVAWSTFQTGVNPGAHNIFDFLTRDKFYYVPRLSSSEISPVRTVLNFWKWKVRFGKPEIKLLRKSKPFWKILGEHGIFSNILRVPITFPPEKFYGNILAAMCIPDLRGSQGTFTLYSSAPAGSEKETGGNRVAVKVTGDKIQSYIQGPDDPTAKEKKPLKVPFRIDFNGADDGCILRVGRETITLKINEFSDWIRLTFKTKLGLSIKGICRFCLRQIYPHFELYVSPINIDPEYPVLPISRPSLYSKYLSKLNGLFGTLGLMEDTWALNEGALDDEAFLKQVYLTHAEREKMLFDALEKTRGGLCMCVFDATDRVQHTFWRYLEQGHPSETNGDGRFKEAIPAIYEKMDTLVGRIMDALGDRDVLLVLSDHGFNSFRRCVNLNTWLVKNGYMALKDPIEGKDYFGDVDWSATRAFSLGMAGVFLNIRGRESKGIVDPRESERLKFEIAEKLRRLCDPLDGKRAIRRVYDSQKIYKGPYKEEAPDLIIGWEEGFRASWECVTGKLKLDVFENNKKAWSGDHCVDPGIVPGVLFCNRRLAHDTPRMIDIAPTVLRLFDIKIPRYMEGKASDIIW